MAGKRRMTDDEDPSINKNDTPQSSASNRRRITAIRPPQDNGVPQPSAFQGRYLVSGSVKLPVNSENQQDTKEIRDFGMELFRVHGQGSAMDLSHVIQKLLQQTEDLVKENNPHCTDPMETDYDFERYCTFESVYDPQAAATAKAEKLANSGITGAAAREAATSGGAAESSSATTGTSSGFTFQPANPPTATPGFNFPTSVAKPPAATPRFQFNAPAASSTSAFAAPSNNDDNLEAMDDPIEVQKNVEDGWSLVATFANVKTRRKTADNKWVTVFQGDLDIQKETSGKNTRLLMKTVHDTYFNLIPSLQPTLKKNDKGKKIDYIFFSGNNAVEEGDAQGQGTFSIAIGNNKSQELFDMIANAAPKKKAT